MTADWTVVTGAVTSTWQETQKFGEIMVVPAEKVNASVDDDMIEEGLEVKAGTLHELE